MIIAGKYLLEGNIRSDASSRFADGNRWGYFPSFSAAWRQTTNPPICCCSSESLQHLDWTFHLHYLYKHPNQIPVMVK